MKISALRFFLLSIFLVSAVSAEKIQMDLSAEGAILMNAETGQILFEKNSQAQFYPASTTKVATLLYTLHEKADDLERILTANKDCLVTISGEEKKKNNFKYPAYWQEPDGTHCGLKEGEQMRFRDLLYGLMLVSGNDAANVIAEHVGGTIPNFMKSTNLYLKQIGCKKTNFSNPHGLHYPDHKTTPFDLAIMAKEGLKHPIFKEVVSTVRYTRPKTNIQKASTWLTNNRLLRSGKLYYPKAIGIKTGSLSIAKKNIVAAATSDGRTLIAVLMKCPDRNIMFEETAKLFEAAFNQPKIKRTVLTAGLQEISRSFKKTNVPLQTYLDSDVTLSYYPAEDPEPSCLLYWDDIILPTHKGDRVGELQLVAKNGETLSRVSIFANNEVKYVWPFNWIAGIRHFIFNHPFWTIILTIVFLWGFVVVIRSLRNTP